MHGGLNVETQPSSPWALGKIPQYRFIATTDKDPLRVYVYCTGTSYYPPNHSTVYRSDDGGKTWRAVLFRSPLRRKKLYNVSDDYVSKQWKIASKARRGAWSSAAATRTCWRCAPAPGSCEPTTAARAGGAAMTGPASDGDAGGQAWACNGLVVTTTWNYYIDPHQPRRHYICYTDIGFARSLDAGQTWIWQALSLPWHNTVYELAFDPAVPGRIWGAMSEQHDIPNNNAIGYNHRTLMHGGVALSKDYGITWKKLPLPEVPGLSVVLDPTSPADRRGSTPRSSRKACTNPSTAARPGPGQQRPGPPRRTWRCRKLQRCEDGTLLVLITGMMVGKGYTTDGVGLYRSTDAAASWTKITGSLELRWPKDFTAKPGDPNTILLSVSGIRGRPQDGGLYRTTDGGLTWKLLAQKGASTSARSTTRSIPAGST